MNQVEIGYDGEQNDGKRHNYGIFRYVDGSVSFYYSTNYLST